MCALTEMIAKGLLPVPPRQTGDGVAGTPGLPGQIPTLSPTPDAPRQSGFVQSASGPASVPTDLTRDSDSEDDYPPHTWNPC